MPGRNAFGLRHNINLNSACLDRLTLLEQLVVLAHEQCHQWQELYGRAAKKPRYHNRQFCDKAAEIGIIVHRPRGHTLRITDPFLALCREHGVVDPVPDFARLARVRGGEGRTKQKKWTCGCPINIRVAVAHFDATCNICGVRYRRAGVFGSLNSKKTVRLDNNHSGCTESAPGG